MHKKLLIIALTLFSSTVQGWTVTYPTKSTLKKADHITSLAITAALGSLMIPNKGKLQDGLFQALEVFAGINIIINGMALKHERSIASFLKLLLPTSILGGLEIFEMIDGDVNPGLEQAAFWTAILGMAGNGIKNIWDIYSLVNYNQSESVQHDA